MIGDLARRIDLVPDVRDLALEGGDALNQSSEDRKGAGRVPDGGSRVLDRFKVVGQAKQPQRFERASVDAERVKDGFEV